MSASLLNPHTKERQKGRGKETHHLKIHEHDGVPRSLLGSGLDEPEGFGAIGGNVGGEVGFDELPFQDCGGEMRRGTGQHF